jgi:hypothetical protein
MERRVLPEAETAGSLKIRERTASLQKCLEDHNTGDKNGRLLNVSLFELLGWTLEAHFAQIEAQDLTRSFRYRTAPGAGCGYIAPHAHRLCTLPRKYDRCITHLAVALLPRRLIASV